MLWKNWAFYSWASFWKSSKKFEVWHIVIYLGWKKLWTFLKVCYSWAPEYELDTRQRSCISTEKLDQGSFKTSDECAIACKNLAHAFIYGECKGDGTCKCFCEEDADQDSYCPRRFDEDYDLYAYTEGKQILQNSTIVQNEM